jgi:RNA-dependent RNA polymerase
MDRFLTEEVDQDEKKSIAAKMIKLVDLYYLALDGHKVNYNLMLWV